MYANNEIGSILPISEIGAVCREQGVIFHTDAVQAVGHLPIDVKAQNVDMLSLSAHKFHGPKGVGALYARRGIPLANLIEGGAQERGKRAGTENVPAIAGMAAALEESCAHLAENAAKVSLLRDKLIAGLSQIPHSALNGDPANRLPGNVNFCFEGIEGESLLLLLDELDMTRYAEKENLFCKENLNMALYSEKVMDHFRNPRNVGVIEDADGIGEIGNAVCGDIMKIYLKSKTTLFRT